MGYLWRMIWLIADGANLVLDHLFPIGFILAVMGIGFCFGYAWRFLFSECGNAELLIMGFSPEIDQKLDHNARVMLKGEYR